MTSGQIPPIRGGNEGLPRAAVQAGTLIGKGHIFLIHNKPSDSFLSVTGAELVPQFRPSKVSCSYLTVNYVIRRKMRCRSQNSP
jgi:hypothetical protein